jgi:phosphoribosylformylglycinamidine (FGAM) synthase-like enzyme
MDRFAYFSPQLVSGDELKGAYAFAVKMAKEHNAPLTVLVNSIGTCSQFLDHIFTEIEKNKLQRYKNISKSGLSIQLKSPDSFKSHESYGVVLALHSSPKAIEKIESNAQTKAIVAVAEINNYAEHLISWKTEKNVIELRC